MALLLYKSNEMFSATELIRKSKIIFDKILDKEIEKAIILRDGKPSFLLMDFEKYENIMAEFEELKGMKVKKQKVSQMESISKPKEVVKIQEEKVFIPEVKEVVQEIPKEEVNSKEELSEEEEIEKAYQSIENMNFDEGMKKEAQEKIKIKILRARKERAELLALQEQEMQREEEAELQLKEQIEEEKRKKERELKEFWD